MRAICRALNPQQPAAKRVARLLADLAGNTPPAALKPLQIELLLAKWRNLAGHTRALYTHMLRKLLHVLDRDDLKPDPVKRRVKHHAAATDEEIARLLTAATPYLRAAILIARDTGLRRSDVLALSEAHTREGHLTIVMQKTKQPLTIPLSPDLQNLIATLPDADHAIPILERVAGHRVTSGTLTQAWQTCRRGARGRRHPRCGLGDRPSQALPGMWRLHDYDRVGRHYRER